VTIVLTRFWESSLCPLVYLLPKLLPYIEEKQTTQWPKEKAQNDKQRSTKHTHETKEHEPHKKPG
jgi:hypothetical protein